MPQKDDADGHPLKPPKRERTVTGEDVSRIQKVRALSSRVETPRDSLAA